MLWKVLSIKSFQFYFVTESTFLKVVVPKAIISPFAYQYALKQ